MKRKARERTASSRAQQWLLWTAVTIISIIAFEALAVTTAMPTVVDALDGEELFALANGVVLATQLVTTALCGLWVDSKGVKPAMYSGLILLATGLAVAALAPTIWVFTLGRFIQGLGGGLCVVPLYVLVGRLVPQDRQPTFFAAFAAAWVLPSLIGPFVAGVLVENAHWRLVFGIPPVLLGLLVGVIAFVFKLLPSMKFTGNLVGMRKIVIAALGTSAGAICLQVISGVEAGQFRWFHVLLVIVALAVIITFVRPLLPRGTLRVSRGIPATVAYRAIINGSVLAVDLYLPLMLQRIHGWTPTAAGITLTVGSLTWAAGSFIQARVTNPQHRITLFSLGSAIATLGLVTSIPMAFGSVPGWILVVTWAVTGCGIGLAYPATTTHALALTDEKSHGAMSSSLQIADSLGLATAIAIAGIIYAVLGGAGSAGFAGLIGAMAGLCALGLWIARRMPAVEGKVTELDTDLA